MDLTERGASTRRHPWEVQRFEAYRRILADHGALASWRVLDVGAGDGWFADSLRPSLPDDADVVCWDIHYDDNDLEPRADGMVRTRDEPTPGFDLVLALDVLEHVPDAASFVTGTLSRLTRPGAAVLVAVPAYQQLFSGHDEALGHHRRYSRDRLLAEITPWVDVAEHGSLFTSLLVPRSVAVGAERLLPRRAEAEHGVGRWDHGDRFTRLVGGALAIDARLGRLAGRVGVRLPGLSHWAFGVAR
ncbi:MAG: methyltransferase domain-containing protein [Ilumatobacter sp.]|nr:methyltransferase domain-containing protein [Ilumatobacter sp.]